MPKIRPPDPVLNPIVSEWIDIETVDRQKINVTLLRVNSQILLEWSSAFSGYLSDTYGSVSS